MEEECHPQREAGSLNNDRERSILHRVRGMDLFPWMPARYALAILGFLGFFNVYALRVNLSVAIVQMDNSTAQQYQHSARTFDWSNTTEGWVLAAFFYGYILTQIPGGWLAERVGGKWVFGVGVVMTSLFTLLTPLAALTNVWLLVAVRILEGFFEGVTFPAMHALWGRWAPPSERTRLTAISYAGPYVGNVVSFPLSAVLCQYGFDGGWPSVFYVFGSLGILWFVLWSLLAHSSPANHPRISDRERLFIESSLAKENHKPKIGTPWYHILTSPHVWGIVIAHFCNNWGFYTLLTCIPTFIKQTLGCNHYIPIVLNGVYSAIPYAFLSVVTLSSGPIADYIRARWLTTTVTRKVFTTTSFILSAVFLLLCGYFGTNTPVAITFLTVAVGIGGLNFGGFNVNHLDIGAAHAGVLMGLTNMFATIPGFIGPQIAKLIAATPNDPKCSEEYISTLRDEWRQVLIIAAEVYLTGAAVYLILGSGKAQPWAVHEGNDITTMSLPKKSMNQEEDIKGDSDSDIDEKVLLISDRPVLDGSAYSIVKDDSSHSTTAG